MKNITKKIIGFVIVAIVVSTYTVNPSQALALPAGFETQVVATGFNQPTTIAFTPDGRIFVAEKSGTVRIIKNGALLPTPLISLSDVNSYGDRGLIGMAVDPNFASNGYLYLSYTFENTPGTAFSGIKTGRIVRVTVVGDTADEFTKLVLVGSIGGNAATPSCDNYAITSDCIASDAPSHTVGGLRFGPDGKLYAATGDGAHFDYADARALRAQNIDSLAGKVLRLNTDGTAPADNPFYNGNPNSNRSKVYAYGFRNMFRFNFRPTTGALYGGDVGWSSFEELNKVVAGGNYGWPCREGNVATPNGLGCNAVGAINPFYVYAHDANGAGSVTAGSFPTGTAYPAQYSSTFFFGDYAQNWIKTMTVSATDTNPVIADFGDAVDGTNGPVEFFTGPEGNIYFISIYTGELKKLTHTSGNRQPIVNISGSPTSGIAPLTVNFSSAGTSDPDGNPITYLWNFGNNATSSLANPTRVYSTNGVYNPTLTVFDNQGGQTTKSIKITVGNQAPTAQITSPVNGSLYNVGQNLTLTGVGTDPENGSISASSMSWRVILHHNIHTHVLEQHIGNNISFTGPDHGDPDVYTEIELTVTDSAGLTDTTSTYIYLNNAGNGNGGNLIDNNSVETTDPQNPSVPATWSQDWWGVNAQAFTFPATGQEGANLRGVRVQISSYTSGDAKWAHAPVQVLPNTQYTFSDYYTSDVVSTLVAQVVLTNGTTAYVNLGTTPGATNFTKVTRTFTTPANARFVTVFHLLERVGILTTDNYSLVLGSGTPVDVTSPTVSITSPANGATVSGVTNINASSTDNVGVSGVKFLIDNVQLGSEDVLAPYTIPWNTASTTNGTRIISAVSRDAIGNKATSTISVTVSNSISTTTGPNLVTNGTFEAGTTLPTGWSKGGWGTNTRTLTYPVTGASSVKAARVEITAHTSGDAKWVHAKVPVTPGTQYIYKDKYRSNIISDVIGEYTLSNGTLSYFSLQKELVPSSNWTQISGTFNPPANATQVTFYHLISSVGWVEVDDVEVRTVGSGTPGEIIPPVVQFITPTNNQTVSGTVNITATSSDNVAVTYVFYAVDGAPITGQLTTAPYAFAWNTNTVSNGPHLLKATTHDPSGNNSTSTITVIVNNSTTTPDTIAPLVAITSPANGATVSGVTNINASSTDNVAVSGVKFLINGAQFGTEDTVAPYTSTWNTASTTNGSYTLLSVSRDTSGNLATSTAVNVTVNNVTPPTGGNMILNPSVETANGAKPLNWNNSKWGTNTATFTYPTLGQDGTKAVSINMTAYTSGDAKWFFDEVTVVPGTTYTFSEYYKSNVVTNVTIKWITSSGAVSYVLLGNPPAAANWTLRTNTITVPAGVTRMTIFHLMNRVGTLDLDNVSLTGPGGTPTDTTAPTITLTSPTASSIVSGSINLSANATDNVGVTGVQFFVDGGVFGAEDTTSPYTLAWNTASTTNGIHTVHARARDAAGNTATTTVINVTVNNIIADTTKPTVSFVSPIDNSNASSTINVTVNAADNIALASIGLSIDGATFGSLSSTSPAVWSVDTTQLTNTTHTFTARATDTSGNFATTSVNINVNNPVIDLIPPTVSITSPSAGSTIGGSMIVNVNATDNVGVQDVHIMVDDENIGIDNTSPYSATIDTTTLTNGVHVISSYADDAAGNIGNATSVSITVYNAPIVPPGTNIILNPSLETVSGANSAMPENWFNGGWGTNNAVYTYPVAGIDGARGARIDMTSYTDGDAKWFFADTTVVAGDVYLFRNQYKSDVTTTVTARFTYADNSVQYRDMITLPASATWNTSNTSVVIPPGVVSMTVFHIINSVGYLEVDNYNLTDESGTSTGNNFTQGMVSLTFDDGWLSQYDNARPILNAVNMKAGFYVMSLETIEAVPNNRLNNPNFEEVTVGDPTTPLMWSKVSTGSNNAVFTYPVPGVANSAAVKVSMTNYTNGEAYWMPVNTTAISGQQYTYSGSYKSDTPTNIMVKYTLIDDSVVIEQVGTLAPASNWTTFNYTFYLRNNLKNISIYHSLQSVGEITLDNVDLNRVLVYMTQAQIQQLQAEGHEVSAHTRTHADLTAITTQQATTEIAGSRTELLGLGMTPVNTFVYPYGNYNPTIQQITQNAGYIGARSTEIGYNLKDTDKFALQIQEINNTTTLAQFQTWVDSARNNRTWLILMFHQVDDQNLQLDVTPALFQEMVTFLDQQQVNVVTMQQGIAQMNP